MKMSIYDSGTPPGSHSVGPGVHDAPTVGGELVAMLFDHDRIHPNPIKDAIGSYKRGDVVEVFPASKHDGNTTTNPISAPFYILKITGITKAQAEHFQRGSDDGMGAPTRKREFMVNIDALPLAVRNALTASRYAAVPWGTLRAQLISKETLRSQ